MSNRLSIFAITIMLISILTLPAIYHDATNHKQNFELSYEKTINNEREVREPIKIDGNEDLAFQAEYNDWPGDGSEDDPYIIEGYEINGKGYGYCISLNNINSHFRLKNNLLYDASTGIHFLNVRNGIIRNNICVNNYNGIYIIESSENIIEKNTVDSKSDLATFIDALGIMLRYSHNNTITYNNASNNDVGFFLSYSNHNLVRHNVISSNRWWGIDILGDHNLLYHNMLLKNSNQARDRGENEWDAGDPEEDGRGGNYWSDYQGADRGDGIGDEPYNISGKTNQDMYPWTDIQIMEEWIKEDEIDPRFRSRYFWLIPFMAIIAVITVVTLLALRDKNSPGY